MAVEPVFTITYWGLTGTLAAPLRPPEVTDKLVRAVTRLVEEDRLSNLKAGPNLEQRVRDVIERHLPYHLRSSYGGNTTCVEVQTPDALLILDCGSGFRELGPVLESRWAKAGAAAVRRAHVLVTHAHMDHTFATPYFVPYYNPANNITIYGSQVVLDSLIAVLDPHSALSKVYFPPTFDQLQALREFHPLEAGATLRIGSTQLTTYALNHPGGCLAYKLENAGRCFVFATDHEQKEVPDLGLAKFAHGADLLYTEGQYIAAEYDGKIGPAGDPPMPRRGWGHSTAEACVATAVAAGVKEVHVGHREPRRGDEELARIDALVREMGRQECRRQGKSEDSTQAMMPYEGMTVRL